MLHGYAFDALRYVVFFVVPFEELGVTVTILAHAKEGAGCTNKQGSTVSFYHFFCFCKRKGGRGGIQ